MLGYTGKRAYLRCLIITVPCSALLPEHDDNSKGAKVFLCFCRKVQALAARFAESSWDAPHKQAAGRHAGMLNGMLPKE